MKNTPVLFDVIQNLNGTQIGSITLNQPKSINALTLEMVRLIQNQLNIWRDQKSIVCIVLKGAGERGFCAGGDVKSIRDIATSSQTESEREKQVRQFFQEEYQLDYDIHTYPKPIIAFCNGIIMGGGVGLMAGCQHRIIFESSRLAMPEVFIGLYPDVGASWFLNKMPNKLGLFLGLTGTPLAAPDILFTGMADYLFSESTLPCILKKIQVIDFQIGDDNLNNSLVACTLYDIEKRCNTILPKGEIELHYPSIKDISKQKSFTDTIEYIQSLNASTDPWIKKIQKKIQEASPLSLFVTWSAFHHAQHLSLKEVFEMEEDLSTGCCMKGDFAEGVRALLVDKDNCPAWQHQLFILKTSAQCLSQDVLEKNLLLDLIYLNQHFFKASPHL